MSHPEIAHAEQIAANRQAVERLVPFFEDFSPDSLARFAEHYSEDAWFKDPFNEVRGIDAIERIFAHMFLQVDAPRFVVVERIVDAGGAVLVWDFHFRLRDWKRNETQTIRGVSHLKFAADGRVCWHRDYWDAAEELLAKLPVIGFIVRALQRRLSAQ
ncbi:nuclear transport factor 2 family protein [Rhodocyclus purpureus]|uniref:nuclear transport factor 2 family protein n=1 Tax=Rhodocyclus purpureus TaxID=1067 RepID=UPI001913C4D6|nr:nuclear transport factor 2 family protein [Rhodocyclus purpureus]MBK5913007.1 isomerase [Rhodocyclus purpureus]